MSEHTSINISGEISLNGRSSKPSFLLLPALPLGEIVKGCSVQLLFQFSCVVNKFDTNNPIKVQICNVCYDFCLASVNKSIATIFLTSSLFDGAFLEKLKNHKLQCFCIQRSYLSFYATKYVK